MYKILNKTNRTIFIGTEKINPLEQKIVNVDSDKFKNLLNNGFISAVKVEEEVILPEPIFELPNVEIVPVQEQPKIVSDFTEETKESVIEKEAVSDKPKPKRKRKKKEN